MQKQSVPVSHLVFPVLLPFAQSIFLKKTVGTDNKHRSSSLKSHTSFNTDDSISYVHISAYTVCAANLLNLLNSLDSIIVGHIVDSLQYAFLKSQTKFLTALFCDLLQISRIGQTLSGIKYLSST